MTYDVLNRLKTRNDTSGEGLSVWTYDSAPGAGKGKLHTLSRSSDGYQETYVYDGYGRPISTSKRIDGTTYTASNRYDTYGRVDLVTYPVSGTSGSFRKLNVYDDDGYLKQIRNADNAGLNYWTRVSTNADGNVTWEVLGNGLHTMRGFDTSTGQLKSITTGSGNQVQDLSYTFDNLGNLESRRDGKQSLMGQVGVNETFAYDALNRLTDTAINGSAAKRYQYDSIGNITNSADLGNYTYGQGTAGPHAVTYVQGATLTYDANGNMTSGRGRTITHTAYNKPKAISKGSASGSYYYDPNRSLYKQVAVSSTGTTATLYVGDLMEVVIKPGGVVEYRNKIHAGNTLIAIYTSRSNSTQDTRYMHADHLGSVTAITAENGAVKERFSYDPFGKRRSVSWNDGFVANLMSNVTGQGFTGHEMLDNVGLVHMGGRVYDPELARFVSADPLVAYPGSTQGWNRYSYADNNPLSRIDPTGHSWISKQWKRMSKDAQTASWYFVSPYAGGVASLSRTETGREALAVGAGVGGTVICGWQCGLAAYYGASKANEAYTKGASFEDAAIYGIANGLKAYSILSAASGAYNAASSAYANANAWGAIESVGSSAAHHYSNQKQREEIGRFARKNGMSLDELNMILLGLSFAGNHAVAGSRLTEDGVILGFDNRGPEGWFFDGVDILLGYQGLPTATSFDYMFSGMRGNYIVAHSLGTLDATNLVGMGMAPGAVVYALPIGNIAPGNVTVVLGDSDPINFSYGGKLLNPRAIMHDTSFSLSSPTASQSFGGSKGYNVNYVGKPIY